MALEDTNYSNPDRTEAISSGDVLSAYCLEVGRELMVSPAREIELGREISEETDTINKLVDRLIEACMVSHAEEARSLQNLLKQHRSLREGNGTVEDRLLLEKEVLAVGRDCPSNGSEIPNLIADLRRSIERREAAVNSLITANLRLVIRIARKYGKLPLSDLIQYGNIGLMKAARRFDYKMGYKFCTYATWWIRSEIGRGIVSSAKTVRTPPLRKLMERLLPEIEAIRTLEKSLGRVPSLEELAKFMGVEVNGDSKKYATLIEALNLYSTFKNGYRDVSLDAPFQPDGDGTLMEVLDTHADDASNPEAGLIRANALYKVREAIGELSPRERKLISLRYGKKQLTLGDIGAIFGISRERVRQIEVKVIRKLIKVLGEGNGISRKRKRARP